MRCSCEVSLAEPVDRIWASLAEVDGVLAAIPGATLVRDGDAVGGSLRCVLGSGQVTYRLSARAETSQPHTAVIAVTGKEARGSGTLSGILTLAVHDDTAGSRLELSADLQVTGRGESVPEAQWRELLTKLLAAASRPRTAPAGSTSSVSPTSAAASTGSTSTRSTSTGSAATPPRPALAVAPAQGDPAPANAELGEHRRLIYGLLIAGLLLALRRHRRRRITRPRSNQGDDE